MALLKWNEEEDKQQEDGFLASPALKTVNSIQNGAWQPTQDNATAEDGSILAQEDQPQDQNQNYLMSDEKAQFDAGQAQRRAAEEAARQAAAAAAAQAAANAQAAAAAQYQASQQQQAAAKPQNVEVSTPKYEVKKEGGLSGFFKGIGAGIQQGFGALGDIAVQGGGAIGSIGKNDQQLAQHLANVERVRGWLHNQRDFTGNQIVGTRDIDQNAANIAAGRGNLRDFTAVGGKGLQAGIDSTMFFNPARMALRGVTPVANQSANILSRAMTNPAARYAARDAAFFGGL